jgi:CRP-like cAMP-binding protein
MPIALRDFILETGNQFLASLPQDEFVRIRPHLHPVTLAPEQMLIAADAPIEHVYFPESGLVSLIHRLKDGGTIEIAMIGSESLVGAHEVIGASLLTAEALVQLRGSALRMPVSVLRAEAERSHELRQLLLRHFQALFVQVSQSAACHGRHVLEERLALWLLMAQDCVGGNELAVSHETLSMILGRRRAGVTVAASTLKAAGLIQNRPGRITILDRAGLEGAACECYEFIRSRCLRLLLER